MEYYDLDTAIKLFIDAKIYPIFDKPQLADLCRQGKLTPLFPHNFHISKPCYNDDDGRPRYTHTQNFSGYLAHDYLASLIDGYTDSLIISYGAKLADESDILLFDGCQREPDYAEPAPVIVTPDKIRLAADEVHRCIDDMKAEHSKATQASNDDELSDNTAKDYLTTIGLLLELLQRKPAGFNKDGTDLPALFPSQAKIIEAIDEQTINNHRYGKVEKRFSLANKAIADKRKQ